MRRSAEVAVVGAGPAGARAAELLAGRGVDVLLVDPKAPWEKPCGGGLTTPLFEDFPQLDELKASTRPLERARLEVAGGAVEVRLANPIRIVARRVLAAWQLDRALRAGARHEAVRVRGLNRTDAGWRLETDQGPLDVSYVVGADGAASLVRSVASPSLDVELAPTRVAYPGIGSVEPDALVLRFYEDRMGYLWDFPRTDHRSVGIVLPGGRFRRPALDACIDRYWEAAAGSGLDSAVRRGAVIGTAQLGHGGFSGVVGEGFALLGDAAGFADPFTGEGIQNAIRSADLLGEAWGRDGLHVQRAYRALVSKTFGSEFAVSRLLRRSLGESGLGVRLLERALSSDAAYAVVTAMLNSLSGRSASLTRLLGEAYAATREGRGGVEPPRK